MMIRHGRVDTRMWTPYAITPSASVTTVIAATIKIVDPIRAATYLQRGTGVPCLRFNTPSSRRIAVKIAMFTYVDAMARIPGTKKSL